MSYLEAKYHLLGGWRVIAFLLNLLLFLGSSWGLYLTGIFTRSWYNEGDAAICILILFTSALNAILITRPMILEKSDDEKSSLLSLWWKRKKLEHLSKINEFKK